LINLIQHRIDGTTDEVILPLSNRPKNNRPLSKNDAQLLDNQRNRPIACVIHNPTYCYVTLRSSDGSPVLQSRNPLSSFGVRNAVQSTQSKTRMSNALNWMLLFAEKKRVYEKATKKTFSFRLAFNTLTIPYPQKHDDDFIKEHLLQPYLYWLTRYYNASYVWKAETQMNGCIHFHITIDTFVHWRSVRAKWNKLLAKHGYCKVFQDGSNDKGNAATQIKAIKNERGLAACIGGYLTRGSIEEKEHTALKKKNNTIISDAIEKGYAISQSIETRMHYTRFVDGRVWGCSASLSLIKCFTTELDNTFKEAEHNFFHDNDLKCLGKKMLYEAEEKYKAIDADTRKAMHRTFEDLEHQFAPYMSVYIHRHLKFTKLPDLIKAKIQTEKLNRKFATQTHFTVDSLN